MDTPEREIAACEQIEGVIDQLPLDQQEKLRQRLNSKAWARRWDNLIRKADDQSIEMLAVADDEIAKEVIAYRSEQHEKLDEGWN